jgi:hypothetical protein
MGRNLQNVTIALAFVALLLSVINTVNGHIQNRDRELTVCTVDLWGISSNISHVLSQKDITPEAAQSEINRAMTQVQNSLLTPQKYGCDIIAVKGSVFGSQVRDITLLIAEETSQPDARK